jgi:CRISPR/Cas system-associated endonuclease/helicase Cas3
MHKSLILDASLRVKKFQSEEFFNKSLNGYQKRAVVNVLRGESRPLLYVIFGSLGTGKTHTIAECIEQIAKKISWSRIIVAALSNSAANLIVGKLAASGRFKSGDFVRFVSYNQIMSDSIPEHIKKYCATIDIGYDHGHHEQVMCAFIAVIRSFIIFLHILRKKERAL